jgi:transcriptional regulator of met regulon
LDWIWIKDIVRLVLAAHYEPDPGNRGPSWLTALAHAKDSLWSVDLFRAESISLKTHWIMVVMDQHTRRIIGFAVHAGNVDGPAICRMFNHATSGQTWPLRLSSDKDPLFSIPAMESEFTCTGDRRNQISAAGADVASIRGVIDRQCQARVTGLDLFLDCD